MSENLYIPVFRHYLEKLHDNLTLYHRTTLANMFAIYHAIEANPDYNPDHHAALYSDRLQNYLAETIIVENNFNSVLSLFAIALTPATPPSEDLPKYQDIGQETNFVPEIIACLLLPEADAFKKNYGSMKALLTACLASEKSAELINFCLSKPEIVIALINKKLTTMKVLEDLTQLATASAKMLETQANLKQIVSIVIGGSIAFGSNLLVINSLEAIAAALIIPLSVAALKYGSQIGEYIGEKVAYGHAAYQGNQRQYQDILKFELPDLFKQLQVHEAELDMGQKIITDFSHINLDSIKNDIAPYIKEQSMEQTIKPAISKSRPRSLEAVRVKIR